MLYKGACYFFDLSNQHLGCTGLMLVIIGQLLLSAGSQVVSNGGIFNVFSISFHGYNIVFVAALMNVLIWVSYHTRIWSVISMGYQAILSTWACQASYGHPMQRINQFYDLCYKRYAFSTI